MGFGDYVRGALSALNAKVNAIQTGYAEIRGAHEAMLATLGGANNITREMDSIPGRRMAYWLSGTLLFDITNSGQRGNPISMLVSQDGPFIMTHYPVVAWRPTLPTTATNFGLWRPVQTVSLPDQAEAAGATFDLDEDIISISWELVSGGSQRNMQNLPALPLLSTPGNAIPLPVPTMFTPNDTIQFFPTFESIRFTGAVPPTQGLLGVTLSGYRIVNM